MGGNHWLVACSLALLGTLPTTMTHNVNNPSPRIPTIGKPQSISPLHGLSTWDFSHSNGGHEKSSSNTCRGWVTALGINPGGTLDISDDGPRFLNLTSYIRREIRMSSSTVILQSFSSQLVSATRWGLILSLCYGMIL